MESFKNRISAVRPTRWVRFAIVSLLFFAWVIWMQNAWLLLLWLLLADIYITGYIPFTWWKKSKNAAVRTVMGWVDAIVYALILVYFVFTFIGQNYTIPTSSLEKSLLVGDYLFVNKVIYGPRVPITPVHLPLVHNRLPIIDTKSYLETPSLPYRRLKGLRNVERGDIVVFNFPAGDTVMSKVQNPDYYTLIELYGRRRVLNDKATFGEQIAYPVDRRENYVKRAIGLPGDTLQIINDLVYINGEPIPQPENVQYNYFFQTKAPLSEEQWELLGVSKDDRNLVSVDPSDNYALASMGFHINENGSVPPVYGSPLTASAIKTLTSMPQFITLVKTPQSTGIGLFPLELSYNWTLENYGGADGIVIPAKGMTVELTPETWALYQRPIRVYEGNSTAELQHDGKVYIDGKPADEYTFNMDYYFMMGDNRDNSLDSRFWGFVPEDHIVGSPWRVLVSFDSDKSVFNGGVRWNRIFKDANPDKKAFADDAARRDSRP